MALEQHHAGHVPALAVLAADAACCRSERKVLNDVNHSSEPQQLRYHVMASLEDGGSNGKLKQRISTAQEKLFILVGMAARQVGRLAAGRESATRCARETYLCTQELQFPIAAVVVACASIDVYHFSIVTH